MKASDYVVEYLIGKGITDVFGYPGGMVTHLMDSFSKYQDRIKAHVTYSEQGAAMAACGYAQTSGKTGVAYATSGPGATNMITGICNAYMDSIPTLFITGQVNSFEQKGKLRVRQRGFQETDIVSMVTSTTKFAKQVNSADDLKYYLDYAFYIANEGRKGPVLLDIAMDVTRTEIEPSQLKSYFPKEKKQNTFSEEDLKLIKEVITKSQKPVFLLGNGNQRNLKFKEVLTRIDALKIPVVSSMISVDVKTNLDNYYGFIGAYGDRVANFVVAKSDLVIAVGARLDIRQAGAKRANFAPNAALIRIDIDAGELEYKVHDSEYGYCLDSGIALESIVSVCESVNNNYSDWKAICDEISEILHGHDDKKYNKLVREISKIIPDHTVITTDVGQNQVWVAQSFETKNDQRILFSGGHGAMGYSLPAAMGASLASKGNVYSFNGDGGIQMNIQELQMIAREQLPVKIILFNNNALGMIRHFQEMYFNHNYFQTTSNGGFTSPDFRKIAKAYGLRYEIVTDVEQVKGLKNILIDNEPALIEVQVFEDTYVFPKLEFGKPNQDQEPLLDRHTYNYLMKLGEEKRNLVDKSERNIID